MVKIKGGAVSITPIDFSKTKIVTFNIKNCSLDIKEKKRVENVNLKTIKYRTRAILNTFCKNKVPSDLFDSWNKEEDNLLQDWVCDNLKPEFSYATGFSIIEAAENIAISQIKNGLEKLIKVDMLKGG